MKASCDSTASEIELFVNDRVLAPNNDATRVAAQPELHAFFAKLFQGRDYTLSHTTEPRRLFGVRVKASKPFTVAQLLGNLGN